MAAARRPGFHDSRAHAEFNGRMQNAGAVAQIMMQEVMQAHSYAEALDVIRRYVTIREEVHG